MLALSICLDMMTRSGLYNVHLSAERPLTALTTSQFTRHRNGVKRKDDQPGKRSNS